MIKVSVIIPVYNMEKYLEECLESVVNQTLKEIEIIIVNDGSTDNSFEIIKRYQKRYLNIVVISQKNKGQSAARNRGLSVAKGEYVGFVDSDDVINIRMYEVLYNTAKKYNSLVVDSHYSKNKSALEAKQAEINTEGVKVIKGNEVLRNLLKTEYGFMCYGIFSFKIFKSLRFKEGITYEDLLLKAQIFNKISKEVILPNKMYFYRTRPDSTMNKKFDLKRYDGILVNQIIYNNLKKYSKDKFRYCYKELLYIGEEHISLILRKAIASGCYIIPKSISRIYILKMLLLANIYRIKDNK